LQFVDGFEAGIFEPFALIGSLKQKNEKIIHFANSTLVSRITLLWEF